MGNYCCCCMRDKIEIPFKSIYEISMRDIDGKMISFEEFRDKVLLIVNIACKCQLSPKNIEQLVLLDKQYRSRGLVVMAFPCNQFYSREFDTAQQIKDYLSKAGVTFKIFEKIDVNGDTACDLYKFLRKYSQLDSTQIGLNFGKFLIDRQGNVFKYYGPLTNPVEIVSDIEKIL